MYIMFTYLENSMISKNILYYFLTAPLKTLNENIHSNKTCTMLIRFCSKEVGVNSAYVLA